jgi:hypothetical protein
MKEVVLDLEKLEKLGTVLFSKSAGKNNKMAIDTLDPKSRKEWIRAEESATKMVEDSIVAESVLRKLVQKIEVKDLLTKISTDKFSNGLFVIQLIENKTISNYQIIVVSK